jgi:hypothetical protein
MSATISASLCAVFGPRFAVGVSLAAVVPSA